MDLELADKVAVVTGAGKGIGLAVVRSLAAEGAHVVAGSRTVTPELAAVAAEAVAVDLSTPDGPAELVARAGGRIDVLVNGPVATDLWLGADGVAARVGRASGQRPEDVAAAAAAGSVTGRFSTPREVADLVAMLASTRTANVTGADFLIDGGLVTTI